jgi:hypothetical protein
MLPHTSQSPAVTTKLVTLALVLFVSDTLDADAGVGYSPTAPALALSAAVVPTMPEVVDGVMAPVACSVVNLPVLGVVAPTEALLTVPPLMVAVLIVGDVPNTIAPLPVSSDSTPANCAEVVAANCDRLPEVNANVVPQDSPLPLVHFSALFAALQLGTACATGMAVLPVGLASKVLAAWVASPLSGTACHVGATPDPLETTVWPAVEPAGFRSCTGASVAENAAVQMSAARAPRIRFKMISLINR